jgi:CheY-like chemotaxis protein
MSEVVLCSAASAKPRRAGVPGILVVDDEQIIRQLLYTVLRRQGFNVWLAASGDEAVQVYAAHQAEIDLVLLDVRMPGPDGPATLAALRQRSATLRCCFMSGDLGGVTKEELLALGAERVFIKPFVSTEMARSLWEMVN